MKLRKIISGGQTGADRGALEAAKSLGFETGGWMPAGFRALDGLHPEFAELYGMQETAALDYPPRTYANVRESDATVRFAKNFGTAGERCTLAAIINYKKPYLDILTTSTAVPLSLAQWLHAKNVEVLNVAGNSEQTSPGIGKYVSEFLFLALEALRILSPSENSGATE